MEITKIKTSQCVMNTGQVEGLPKNPRQWTKEELDNLAASLTETPELFEARPLLVYPHDGKYIVLGGNMRLSAAKQNKAKDVPAIVFPKDTPIAKLKEIVLKDNGSFGSWDYDQLANEWDDLPLTDWGVPAWSFDEKGNTSESGGGTDCEENEEKSFESRIVVATCSLNGESSDIVLCKSLTKEETEDFLGVIKERGAKIVIEEIMRNIKINGGGVNERYNGKSWLVTLLLCRHNGQKVVDAGRESKYRA